MLQVSHLFVYPIKSLGGVEVTSAQVTDRGLQHDRRWMLVDAQNRFLSQREMPHMALLKVSVSADGLIVTYAPDPGSQILIPFLPQTNRVGNFTIWDDVCAGQYVGYQYDEWFSGILKFNCRLVYMPDDALRPVDPQYSPAGKITSFADAYPFLIIGQASLDDLNSRIGQALPMNRFRPNIVFTGGTPYQEDSIAQLKIGDIQFNGVKLCARCPIPTIDQDTTVRSKEPLKTLATYRNRNNKVYFGQNLVHSGQGTINTGDAMEIIEVKEMLNSLNT